MSGTRRALGGTKVRASRDAAAKPALVRRLDDTMKARARKVWRLYVSPLAGEGERRAAMARLEEMVASCGMADAAFVTACGLRKVRVRVKAGSLVSAQT